MPCHFLPERGKMTRRLICPLHAYYSPRSVQFGKRPGTQTRLENHPSDTVLTYSNRKIAINPMTLWFMISNCSKKFKIWKPKIKFINGRIYHIFTVLKTQLQHQDKGKNMLLIPNVSIKLNNNHKNQNTK